MAEHLEEIRIDGDDLDDVLLEMERSFGISFPQDLTHVQTAGDLFAEIRKVREPNGRGDRCDTAMSFFLLRRTLSGFGLKASANPRTELAGQGLPSPRKVAKFIREEAGLEAPDIVVSKVGCLVALAIFAGAIALALATWSEQWLALWVLIVPLLALDRGGWEGDWKTLGSLARAVAVRNVAYFASQGARNRESDWWRSYSHLLARIVVPASGKSEIEPDRIRPETRFNFN